MATSIKTDANGRPLMLRDSRTASNNFKFGNTWWDGVPKPKFLFYLRFFRADGSNGGSSTFNGTTAAQSLDWSRGVGLMVKSVNQPAIKFDTDTLNQYNKKRVIQKRVEYGPITIRFHDTVDSRSYVMFEDYFKFYYGDARSQSDTDWNWDITAAELKKPSTGYWGFNPPKVEPNFAYFFSRIEVYSLYGSRYSRYDLVNPKITSFDPDELDFSEGQIGREITMHLDYEGIVYKGHLLKLSEASGLIEEMNLDKASYYEPDDAEAAANGNIRPSQVANAPAGGNADFRAISAMNERGLDQTLNRLQNIPSLNYAGTNGGVAGNPSTSIDSNNTGRIDNRDVNGGRGTNAANLLTDAYKR